MKIVVQQLGVKFYICPRMLYLTFSK